MLLRAALLSLLTPSAALACGGFFCNAGTPVDQTKEQILFVVDDVEGWVEVQVQIAYTGPAESFAWVVPVPSVPEVAIASDAVLNLLGASTQPVFSIQTEYLGYCQPEASTNDTDAFGNADTAAGGGGPGGGGGAPNPVLVLSEAQVGPYDQVTLSATDADALVSWLQTNGYAIPTTMSAALAPYISTTGIFVAFKLQKNQTTGQIAPIAMKYAARSAMIPLVLTSVAAQPDMRVIPMVLHRSKRAVPDNYLHVRVDEARIDWAARGANYDEVVTQAANEAGGQAFATDSLLTDTSALRNAFAWANSVNRSALHRATDPDQFINTMLMEGIPSSADTLALLRTWVPMPASAVAAGISESSWYNCIACYPNHPPTIPFDPIGLTAALWERVVIPSVHMRTLLGTYPRLTRLSSSMSAAEMTSDAMFTMIDDPTIIPSLRTAVYTMECWRGETLSNAHRWVDLRDGRRVYLPPIAQLPSFGGSDAAWLASLNVPAALQIEDYAPDGAITTLVDNSARARAGLNAAAETLGAPYSYPDPPVGDDDEPATPETPEAPDADLTEGAEPADTACGCAEGSPAPVAWAWIALAGLMRRRR